MTAMQPLGLLIGRVLLALIFILSGFGKITSFAASASYMASKGLPMPELLLLPTILIELGGGLLIAIGYKARWAALAIFLFLIPTTLIFHNFWAVEAEQVRVQMIQFQKNLAIMGGMLYIVFTGAGRYSLDKD
ncbi:MAG: DoxX family protein [Acidobacteria bacterium]|nr:DoxX family protein [Acidobacteriota bacterium]